MVLAYCLKNKPLPILGRENNMGMVCFSNDWDPKNASCNYLRIYIDKYLKPKSNSRHQFMDNLENY